MNYNELKSTIK